MGSNFVACSKRFVQERHHVIEDESEHIEVRRLDYLGIIDTSYSNIAASNGHAYDYPLEVVSDIIDVTEDVLPVAIHQTIWNWSRFFCTHALDLA